VCEGVRWWSCYFLLRIQKFIPIIIISFIIRGIIWILIIIRLIVGVLGRFNQIKIKKLLVYSSIHHIGWIFIIIIVREYICIMYLLIYSFIILIVFLFLRKINVIRFIDLIKVKLKWIFILNLISIGGVPPLLGFFFFEIN